MNPFDSASDSPPDFVDPADVIIGPWAGSSAQNPPLDEDSGAAKPARRSARRARNDREPPPDKQGVDAEPQDVARTIVLRQLAAAPRSRKQLADKLRERDCDDDIATEVLDRLEEVGLVDDAAYAATLVQSQQSRRAMGRRAISQELRRKGIASEIIDAQLDTINDEDERNRAEMLVAKKLRSMHGLDATVQARRLGGMLARKGYSSSIAWSVIREAIADAPEHQPD